MGTLLLIPALGMYFFIACTGCSKSEVKKTDGGGGDGGGAKPATTASADIDTPTEATLVGVVKYKGEWPKQEQEPAIAMNEKEGPKCLDGARKIDKIKQTWIVSDKGEVANVIVFIEPPKGKKFKITEALKEPFKKKLVVDQMFCAYEPHVAALYAGVEPIEFKNSAKMGHNVKVAGGANPENTPKGKTLAPGESWDLPPFAYEKDAIPISCDIHGWMSGKIKLFNNPYFDTTKLDGSFKIASVPIDTELTVYMWHEEKGKVEAKKMKLNKGENKLELEISR
jgi:hypothetical protein